MKNTIKILSIISLMLVIGFSMMSCDDKGDNDEWSDFKGTWTSESGSKYIITSKEFTWIYSPGTSWTSDIDSVEPAENTNTTGKVDYPNGFTFSVIVKKSNVPGRE